MFVLLGGFNDRRRSNGVKRKTRRRLRCQSLMCNVETKPHLCWKLLQQRTRGGRRKKNIITLQSKVSLTGHAPPFMSAISSLRFYIWQDKLSLASWDAKKGLLHAWGEDGAGFCGRSCSLGFITSTARQHRTEPRRALNTINGLFVYTYRRRMGMISAIDPL